MTPLQEKDRVVAVRATKSLKQFKTDEDRTDYLMGLLEGFALRILQDADTR